MPIQQLDTDLGPQIRKPGGHLDRIKEMFRNFSRDSIMEPGFMDTVNAEEDDPVRDAANMQALFGSYVRKGLVDPIKQYKVAIEKGMSGKELNMSDLMAITQVHMDMAGGGGFTKGLSKQALDPTVMRQFPAMHGSPHLIKDKFRNKAIGSGEGAQYFGHGHYLTDSPGIAKSYSRIQRKIPSYKGADIEDGTAVSHIGGYMDDFDYTPDRAKAAAKEQISSEIEELDMNLHEYTDELTEKYNVEGIYELEELDSVHTEDILRLNKFSEKRQFLETELKSIDEIDPSDFSYKQIGGKKGFYGDEQVDLGNLTTTDLNAQAKRDLIKSYTRVKAHIEPEPDFPGKRKKMAKEDLLQDLEDDIANYTRRSDSEHNRKGLEQLKQKFDEVESLDEDLLRVENSDFTYKTTVMKGKDPEEYDFLDWEDPVGRNPEVYVKLDDSGILDKALPYIELHESVTPFEYVTGDDINRGLYGHFKDQGSKTPAADASQELLKAGISGNRYDAGSLGGGAKPGTKNYVVFDPKDITIESTYLSGEPYRPYRKSKKE